MKKQLLIDGDILAYEVAFGVQRVMYDDAIGGLVQYVLEDDVHEAVDSVINKYMEDLQADNYFIAITDSENNFRKEVFEEYKKHRVDIEKPLALQVLDKYPNGMIKGYLIDKYGAVKYDRLEADDVLSMEASRKEEGVQKIIVSIDKDFEQCGGCYLFNPSKDLEPRYIEPANGNLFFLTQVIAGDPTDNYAGIKGMGMVTGERYLKEQGATWDNVVSLYVDKGMTEEEALMNARCAWLLRDGQYDNGKVELFTPEFLNHG